MEVNSCENYKPKEEVGASFPMATTGSFRTSVDFVPVL